MYTSEDLSAGGIIYGTLISCRAGLAPDFWNASGSNCTSMICMGCSKLTAFWNMSAYCNTGLNPPFTGSLLCCGRMGGFTKSSFCFLFCSQSKSLLLLPSAIADAACPGSEEKPAPPRT